VKFLRSDNEFTSLKFKEYLASEGIEHQLSIPRQLEQNEVPERMNRTLNERMNRILTEHATV